MLYLKQRKQIALHVACGDITDVELKNGKFIINVYDGMLLNLLNAGKNEIEQNDAQDRGNDGINLMIGDYGSYKHAKNIDHDDAWIR